MSDQSNIISILLTNLALILSFSVNCKFVYLPPVVCQVTPKKSAELGSLAQIRRKGSEQNPNLYATKFVREARYKGRGGSESLSCLGAQIIFFVSGCFAAH